jgi:hypothetical protein
MNTVVRSIFIILFVSCTPLMARAQVGRTVAIPSVWAHNPEDQVLADELTNALKAGVSTVPDWTVSGLDIQLSELMRACQTEDAATDECMVRMASARDATVVDDLIVFVGLFRNDSGPPTTLRLSLSIYDAASGLTPGSIDVQVERITSIADRSHLATEWLNRLARLIAPMPTTAEAITAESSTVTVLGLSAVDGDEEFASLLTNGLRATASHSTHWTYRPHDVSLGQAMLGFGCGEETAPSADCLGRIASANGGYDADQVVFGTMHRIGEGAQLRMVLELSLFDARVRRVTRGFSLEMTVEQILTMAERDRVVADCISRLTSMDSGGDPLIARRHLAPSANSGFDAELIGWPLLGLAAASLGVVIASALQVNDIQSNPDFVAYRSSFGTGTGNVCSQSGSTALDMRGHSLCSDADLWETLEIAFGVIGGAALAGGLTALLVDFMGGHPSDEHSLSLRPTIGPNLARLDLSLAF